MTRYIVTALLNEHAAQQDRIDRLEDQNDALQDELDAIVKLVEALPKVEGDVAIVRDREMARFRIVAQDGMDNDLGEFIHDDYAVALSALLQWRQGRP